MIDYKEYAKQMRENNIAVNGIIQVTEELWLQIADIIDELAEKQIPKKPTICTDTRDLFDCCGDVIETYETDVCECPNCGEYLIDKDALEEFPWLLKYNYCNACGQALDWGQEE